jgi:uncharacterized protein YcbX
MPHVSRLNIAPVRSLGLEHREAIDVTELGVLEDRRFYVTDGANRLVDQLIEATMVRVKAWTDPEATRLRLTFPDGAVVDGEVALTDAVETDVHKRTAVGRVVDGPWAAALGDFLGKEVRIVRCDRPGGTRAGNPTSLITDGSLAELARQSGVAAVDARRFRMLIELDGAEAREEDGWIGQRIAIGDAVLRITKPVARCAITTQHPDTGVRDLDTLRTLIAYRGLRDGKHADFGVLGDVAQPGTIRLGDEVTVLPEGVS